MENANIPDAFFTLVFTSKTSLSWLERSRLESTQANWMHVGTWSLMGCHIQALRERLMAWQGCSG